MGWCREVGVYLEKLLRTLWFRVSLAVALIDIGLIFWEEFPLPLVREYRWAVLWFLVLVAGFDVWRKEYRRAEAGTLDRLDVTQPEWEEEPVIHFRGERLYAHHREANWIHKPIDMPLIVQGESSQKITYLMKAGIREKDPTQFARQFGRLEDYALTVAWEYHGVMQHSGQETQVDVTFLEFKDLVYGHWHTEGSDDLVEAAETAASEGSKRVE
jgi:hypothetical protein